MIVLESQGEHALEAGQRRRALAELQQDFAEARERVFMIGIETARFFKRAPRPGVLLARQPCIAHTDVQLDGVRVQTEPFAQSIYRIVVLSLVVELMRTFVVFVGTEERIRDGCAIIRNGERLHKRPRAAILTGHALGIH